MARAKGETPLTGQSAITADAAPYLEPGSTTWNEVFNMMSTRHTQGQVDIFGDTHAKYVKYDWLRSDKSKAAIAPGVAALNLANGTNWTKTINYASVVVNDESKYLWDDK